MILPRRMGCALGLTLPVLDAAVLAAWARPAPPAPLMAGQSGQTRAAPITIAQPSAPLPPPLAVAVPPPAPAIPPPLGLPPPPAQHADAAPVPSGSSRRAGPPPHPVTLRPPRAHPLGSPPPCASGAAPRGRNTGPPPLS